MRSWSRRFFSEKPFVLFSLFWIISICLTIVDLPLSPKKQKSKKRINSLSHNSSHVTSIYSIRVPQAPLEFPWVSCKANMPCSAAGTPCGAANMLHCATDTPCGTADTPHGVANTATFTAFTSFLAIFENFSKCFQLFFLKPSLR